MHFLTKQGYYKINREELIEGIHIIDINLKYSGTFSEYVSLIADELKSKINLN